MTRTDAEHLENAREHLRILDAHMQRTWPAIASVRNRIAHGYTYVDREIIDNTVAHDLDDLERAIDRLAEELDHADEQGSPPADVR